MQTAPSLKKVRCGLNLGTEAGTRLHDERRKPGAGIATATVPLPPQSRIRPGHSPSERIAQRPTTCDGIGAVATSVEDRKSSGERAVRKLTA
jgi:hypothetical protein